MDKNKIIAQLLALLQDTSAVQCDLVLTFVEHMTNRARDDKASGKTFTFTDPEIIKIAEALSDARLAGRVYGGDYLAADVKAMLENETGTMLLFGFTKSEAIDAAYVTRRAQSSPEMMHKIMIYALAFEKAYQDEAEQANKE